MKQTKKIIAFLICVTMLISMFSGIPVSAAPKDGTVITGLQTDYMENPIGTDQAAPVFSWKMQSETRGEIQTAYQVMVASSAEKLAAGDYDVWDSGQVISGVAVGIVYSGKQLAPATRYYWQVMVWDRNGNPVLSQEEAFFETGLMDTGWDGAEWIQLGDGSSETEPAGDTKKFSISVDFKIESFVFSLIFGAKDSGNFYMWQVNTKSDATRVLLRPHQWKNGSAGTIGTQPALTQVFPTKADAIGSVHNMKLDVDNGLVKTYIDDVLVDTRTIDAIEPGFVGARSYEGSGEDERFYMDNIVVKDSNGKVLFEDHFDDVSNPNFSGGTIIDEMLYLKYNGIVLQKPKVSEKVYTVEADFEIENTAFGLIFGAKDSNNFYMWQINTRNNATEVLFRPHQWTNGSPSSLANITIPKTVFPTKADAIGTVNHIKIEIGEKLVTTYINGIQVDSRVLNITEPGHVGLRAYNPAPESERFFADNIIVKDPEGKIIFSEDFSDPANCAFSFDNGKIIGGRLYLTDGVLLEGISSSAPMLRHEFSTDGKIVKKARLYATAAGIYTMYINGQAVSPDYFNPGRTEYNVRVLYQTFDVTPLLKTGANALAAELGLGWYAGAQGGYGSTPALLAKLVVEYTDGSSEVIGSDESWRTSADGPVLDNNFFQGEKYDANKELSGWNDTGFNDSAWIPAKVSTAQALGLGKITAQVGPTVRHMRTVDAIEMTEPVEGVYVYDFGQNLVGVEQISITGDKGRKITMRHGEMLNDADGPARGCDGPKGTIYTANYRSAKCINTYTLKGDPSGETYAPTMFFTGFRYLEITGIDEPLPLEDVKALVLHSDMDITSTFNSSDSLVNQLYSNTIWGQMGNFLSIPTDCPQRDERMGWTGDIQVFARTSSYNMNDAAFLYKFIQDLNDCQRADGAYADVAPAARYFSFGTGGWAEAGIIVPWQMYQQFGDVSILRDNYTNMGKFIDYNLSTSTDYIRDHGWTGDWLSIGESTPFGVTDTAYAAYAAKLMARIAEVLNQTEDIAKYEGIYQNYKAAWQKAYVLADGKTTVNTQTSYVVGLEFDLFNPQQREAAARYLVENIKNKGWHLATGFLGVSYLNPVLTDMGYSDVAFQLLEQDTYPSWLYPILQGATTIWERWNSYTLESGFGDVGMNSFNHYSYGSVCEWLYKDVLGIERDESAVAYKHFTLQPTTGGTLTHAKGSFESMYGAISAGWELGEHNQLTYDATIPANTSATLVLPVPSKGTILMEGTVPADEAEGVTFLKTEGNKNYYEIGSGSYHFTLTTDPNLSKFFNITITNPDGVDAKAIIGGQEYTLPVTKAVYGGDKDIEIISNDPKYTYSHVTGDLFSTGKPLSVYLSGDLTLDARFAYTGQENTNNQATLTLTGPQGSGVWINGSKKALPYTGTFEKGSRAEIALDTPGEGRSFVKWTDGMIQGSPAYVVMNSDVTAEMVTVIPAANRNAALFSHVTTNSTEELPSYGWSVTKLTDGVNKGVGYTSAKLTASDLSENPVWVDMDLGSDTYFDEMVLYPRSDSDAKNAGRAAFPQDFTISVKKDGAGEYEDIKTVTGCADSLDPLTVSFGGVSARFVRVTVTKASEKLAPNDNAFRIQFAEIELYNTYNREATTLVSSIGLTASATSVNVGETVDLTAAVSPFYVDNKDVFWYLSETDAQSGAYDPARCAMLNTSGSKALLTGLSKGSVWAIAEAADGSGRRGMVLITIGEQTKSSVQAVDPEGNPLEWVTKDEWFAVSVVTTDDITKISLINENGMTMGLRDKVCIDNGDGTLTWTFKMTIGTSGEGRTLTLATTTADGTYTVTDATLTVDVIAPAPLVLSASVEGTAIVNAPISVTVVTNKTVNKVTLYNESGMNMGVLSSTYEDTNTTRVWTVQIKIGTKGTRAFTAYGKDKLGNISAGVTTNAVVVSPPQ